MKPDTRSAFDQPLMPGARIVPVGEVVDGDVSMPDLRSSERWREIDYEDHMPTADTPAWRTVTLVKA